MAKPSHKRDLEALIADTKKNRVQLQKTWKKLEKLDAAIQSAREVNGHHHHDK